MLSRTEKMIKKRRELLAVYMPIDAGVLRRIYPESFYPDQSFADDQEMEYIEFIYEIFCTVIDGYRKTIIEDEINLMHMEIERRAALGKFSDEVLSAIRGRLSLRKKYFQRIEAQAMEVELKLPEMAESPPDIRFRMENTVYLVRLLAYGLYSDNDIVLDRVAEVFDIDKLQAATKPRERKNMDSTLKFLYRGLIQKNERGRQGNRHAARQTLDTMREWYEDNEYVNECIDKIEKYLR